jgi:hypothetical protein
MIRPDELISALPLLAKRAIQLNLGAPIYGERDVKAADGSVYHIWFWQRGGLYVRDGDYSDLANAKLFHPLTGQPLAAPLPWPWEDGSTPPPTPPPTTVNRLRAFPNSYAGLHFKADWFQPAPNQQFYGLINVTDPPVLDIGARIVIQVGDGNGQPSPGVACYHVYATGYECFKTDGFGLTSFNLGSGSGYSASTGQTPHDQFYVGSEYRNRDTQPPAPPIGDTYYYGLPDGHHIDCTYSLRLMAG